MLKKECLFYDKISGKNYQFFKCKYFKRAYIRAENEQVIKSFQNMLSHLFLKPGFDKSKIEFKVDGSKVIFSMEGEKKEFSLEDETYNNIIFDIKDLLIDKAGYFDKTINFKIIQLNKYEIKFELENESFIYNVNNKYDEFVNLCNKVSDSSEIITYIKKNFKFVKSSQLMKISKEMRVLYDPIHCHSMIRGSFKDVSEIEITYSKTKTFMNNLTIRNSGDTPMELVVYGLGIGGTLTELYYLSSILNYYGFYHKVEDLLINLDMDEFKIKFFKDKLPVIEDIQSGNI
jgi:hypothetical protein